MKNAMTLQRAVSTVVKDIHTKGVAWTTQACVHELKELWFDWRFGVDTWGAIPLQNMDIAGGSLAHANHYEPSPLPLMEDVFTALEDLHLEYDQFVFVDLGSGKGRTLLRAAQLPFKRVVGVEVSPGLHQVALSNVSRLQQSGRRIAPIECIMKDAAAFTIPAGNTVLYMYHPFDDKVLNQVLDNLQCSLQIVGSKAYVVYAYPCLSKEIGSRGFLNRVLDRKTQTTMNAYAERSSLDAPFEIWESSIA